MKVLKQVSFYPFLFILYAVLAPLASNLDQIPASLAVRPLVVLLSAAAVLLLLTYLIFRDGQYAAYLVFLLFIFFFLFAHLSRLAQGKLPLLDQPSGKEMFLGLWALILLVLSLRPVWKAIGGRAWMIPFFNIVFLVALAQPVYRVAASTIPKITPAGAASDSSLPNTGDIHLDCRNTPDIYYIILDAYGRQDVLSDLYGVDNQPFLDFLKRKGFFVAEGSHTNYTQTIFSLPASLNFDYIDPPTGSQDDGQYFLQRINDNSLMRLLKTCGYQVAVLDSGYFYSDQIDADKRLTGSGMLNEFESLLLAGTPVEVIAERYQVELEAASYAAHRQRVLDGFDQLRWAYQVPGPKIVFAHLITPHPPFVFDALGKPIEPNRGYDMGDGDDYLGDLQEYRQGYAGQVKFANRKLQTAITALLSKSRTPPVIILQGDHGPGSDLNWGSPAASCLWERSTILNAYYIPGGSEQLYDSISPVNSFRVVLNAEFGANIPLLPDRTYFTSHRLIRQAIDITGQRDSKANCK